MKDTYSEQKKYFEERLTFYLQTEQFITTFFNALETGYLSEEYISASLFLDIAKFTRPARYLSDGVLPAVQNLEPTLVEFKADLRLLVQAGVPEKIIMTWIREVAQNFDQSILNRRRL